MKTILALVCLMGLLLLAGCPNPSNDPVPQTIQITLDFDRFVNGVRTSPFGRIAATENDWVHILSSSAVALINVTNINDSEDSQLINTTFPEINNINITLVVGETYNINLSYSINEHANGLAFGATSGNVTILSTTTSIPMATFTGQSLVLLDKTNVDPTFQPRFDDANGTLPSAFSLFESTLFWYVYVEPDGTDPYVFQYRNNVGDIVTNTIPVFIPETIYFMSESEKGSIFLQFDWDTIFTNTIIIGN